MGTAFLAIERHTGRKVCIKQLHAGVNVDSMRQECEALARLDHPNIVRFLGTITQDDIPSLVIEYIEGTSLEEHVQRSGALPERVAIEIMAQVFDALAYAHARAVIHRDLKPENVLVVWENGAPLVRVVDFGISLVDSLDAHGHVTGSGVVIGTPAYMAPEQVQAEQSSAAVDVYAAGVMLARLITSRQPFSGSIMQIFARKAFAQPDGLDLSTGPAPLPSDALCKLIGACTRTDPSRRPAAAEVLAELRHQMNAVPVS
ncbi:serine/threonine-protein kinase [Polyangium sp. y55x31]|uniref:serine/threonine-protein kinase n=1 Tax=Polyangium sp. y55x31 TaxID=3042688 RepID=UPI0024826D38|nr:serine/threonine-protein kinase [Polyangium sp. y55x31]MDI1484714.1 serine/threonine-protein kinase [Polyangium sp. y55x31]